MVNSKTENKIVKLDGCVLGHLQSKTPLDLYYETMIWDIEDDFLMHFALMGFTSEDLIEVNRIAKESTKDEAISNIMQMADRCNCMGQAYKFLCL
jgi:hypothetical protein